MPLVVLTVLLSTLSQLWKYARTRYQKVPLPGLSTVVTVVRGVTVATSV